MAALVYATVKELADALNPPWLKQPYGHAFVRAFADVKDDQVARAKDATKIRFPTHATRDALDALGHERGLARGTADTNASHAERLRNAWAIWATAGTALGILRALHFLGYPNAILVSGRGVVHTLDANLELVIGSTNGSVAWTMGTAAWSRFVVIFPTPHVQRWTDIGIPAQDSGEGQLIIETIIRWKPAFAMLERIIIQRTGPLWGFPFTVTWGGGGRVWGGGLDPIVWDIGA